MKSLQIEVVAALIMVLAGASIPRKAWAEAAAQAAGETPSQAQAQAQAPAPAPVVTPQAPGAQKPARSRASKIQSKRPREKEAEGTEAADRFEADTVIKSKYRLNGESLEVDPD